MFRHFTKYFVAGSFAPFTHRVLYPQTAFLSTYTRFYTSNSNNNASNSLLKLAEELKKIQVPTKQKQRPRLYRSIKRRLREKLTITTTRKPLIVLEQTTKTVEKPKTQDTDLYKLRAQTNQEDVGIDDLITVEDQELEQRKSLDEHPKKERKTESTNEIKTESSNEELKKKVPQKHEPVHVEDLPPTEEEQASLVGASQYTLQRLAKKKRKDQIQYKPKLTREERIEIKQLHKKDPNKYTVPYLAQLYNVHRMDIVRLLRNKFIPDDIKAQEEE